MKVDDSVKELLANRRTKSEWYEALGILNVGDLPQLDAEDSVRFWATALQNHPGPLGRLFASEIRASFDEYNDPNVFFLGREDVAEIAHALNHLNQEYFVELFRSWDSSWINHAWFYEPLRTFLSSLNRKGKAVIVIWEN